MLRPVLAQGMHLFIDPQPPDMILTPVPTVNQSDALSDIDTTLKFVRVLQPRSDGLVAFEFAIGWPDLAVELLLPAQAFVEFCATHRVQRMDA